MACLPLDRLAPTRRPPERSTGSQRWRELLFVHWALPAEAVRAVVPAGLELDPWDGAAFVGLVPFHMRDTRPWWLPRAFSLDFLETNLRTYVHHRGEPGVYFFSLEASSWLAVQAARAGWGLPYHHAQMRSTRDGGEHHSTSKRRAGGAHLEARWRPLGDPAPATVGSLEHFLLERYLLFSEHRGVLHRGQVHHVPYPAQRAELLQLDEGLLAAAGLQRPGGAPAAVHYSEGVDMEVFGPSPIG